MLWKGKYVADYETYRLALETVTVLILIFEQWRR